MCDIRCISIKNIFRFIICQCVLPFKCNSCDTVGKEIYTVVCKLFSCICFFIEQIRTRWKQTETELTISNSAVMSLISMTNLSFSFSNFAALFLACSKRSSSSVILASSLRLFDGKGSYKMRSWMFHRWEVTSQSYRGVISTFSGGGAKFFLIFQCHRTIEKMEKIALYM